MEAKRRTVRVMPGDLLTAARGKMAEEWRPYRWRDPARCSPERLAELDAHDRHIARLDVLLRPYRPGKGQV